MRKHPASGRYFRGATALTVCLFLLPACTAGQAEDVIQLARGASTKVFGSLGRGTGEIKAASSDVRTFASRYGTSADQVAAVAANADTYRGWTVPQRSIDRMVAAAKNDKVVAGGVSIACEWMEGKLTSWAAFQSSLMSAVAGSVYNDAYAYHKATEDLAKDLAANKNQGSKEDKAAAA